MAGLDLLGADMPLCILPLQRTRITQARISSILYELAEHLRGLADKNSENPPSVSSEN